jgi:GDPmannose 4,6-dehydratase
MEAKRDWGHAKDYVEGMWRMLQQDTSDDYVLATGEAYSVRQFVELSFAELGMTIAWKGSGLDEEGVCEESGKTVVRIDPRYFRPTEVEFLLGDASKARKQLGWVPQHSFADLVHDMIEADLAQAKAEQG